VVAILTVAIFPRKARLDTWEERLVLESLCSVVGDSSEEFSFNVTLSANDFWKPVESNICRKQGWQRNAGKTLEQGWSRKKSAKVRLIHRSRVRLPGADWLELYYPFTGGFNHLTPDSDRSPEAAGTTDS
jgi:hypothetical protein